MPETDTLSHGEVLQARKRRLVAMRLQEIEGNPLDAAQIAMFEMFEREGWSHERRRAYILAHLRAVHRHLFQDVYDWAGELRTVEIAKGRHQFQFRRFIETGMADVHRRLENAKFLQGLSRADFAKAAGEIIGDINYVHPFREGNGRTQLFYLEQLAERAGHPLDLARLDPNRWIEASRQ